MSGTFETFLALSEQDKRDVFEASASRLDTLPSYSVFRITDTYDLDSPADDQNLHT